MLICGKLCIMQIFETLSSQGSTSVQRTLLKGILKIYQRLTCMLGSCLPIFMHENPCLHSSLWNGARVSPMVLLSKKRVQGVKILKL